MKLPINKFKQTLQNGKAQFGLWLGLPDAICAEICASAGFDWVLIDSEHAPYSLKDIQRHLQAIEPYDVPALIRPAEGSTALIKQLLDIGAQTLLIPMVETAEQARQLVKAVRYPPDGIRGAGPSMARAARWNRVDNYLHEANRQICLIVQVETIEAVNNLADIATVEGIDGVFIGPSDLSASMGHLGNPGHPAVIAAIKNSLDIITSAGKAAGILSVDEKLAKQYVEHGASFIGVGVDAALLSHATQALAKRFIPSLNDSKMKY